jgi:hypothetical protein
MAPIISLCTTSEFIEFLEIKKFIPEAFIAVRRGEKGKSKPDLTPIGKKLLENIFS